MIRHPLRAPHVVQRPSEGMPAGGWAAADLNLPALWYHALADFWAAKQCDHCRAFESIIQRKDHHAEVMLDWIQNIGLDPGSVCEYEPALTLYRWSRWFAKRWCDATGNLREIPELT